VSRSRNRDTDDKASNGRWSFSLLIATLTEDSVQPTLASAELVPASCGRLISGLKKLAKVDLANFSCCREAFGKRRLGRFSGAVGGLLDSP
jgi:hypothetical protein